MRNSSWKGWFGAEVGFSIYIHRRGFTSSCTINHQSVLPASQGARARRAARAHARYAYAPCAHAPCAHAPYAYALYAPRHTRVIRRRAPRPRAPRPRAPRPRALRSRGPRSRAHARHARAPHARAPYARAPYAHATPAFARTRWATPPYRCPSPPCRGVYPRDKGAAACAGRSDLLATVARAVESRHGASDNMRRPKPKPTRKPGPENRHSAIPSAWRSRRHSGATAGARGAAGRLAGELDRGIQNSI